MSQFFHSLLTEVGLPVRPGLDNPLITNLTFDSRLVREGSLFIGFQGDQFDGGLFWSQALLSGAVAAIIGQAAAEKKPPKQNDPVVVVIEPVVEWAGELAAAFWKRPSIRMPLIGVTGTNGKTTTSYLIEHLSNSLGKPSALFGTLVNRWPNHTSVAKNTTGFADVLQMQLAKAIEAGAQLGVMEVSSHALAQKRVAGCKFSGAVFTNLTQDHLDYHDSMESYFEAKSLLFSHPLYDLGNTSSVVNIDNSWGLRLANSLGKSSWRCSLQEGVIESGEAELSIDNLELIDGVLRGRLRSPFGSGHFRTNLIGKFNLMNLLQAVGILLLQGMPLSDLLESTLSFKGVPGRMQKVELLNCIEASSLPTVLVDYAHTPDGLKNALIASRSFTKGKLFCVFGCGGNRDRDKRQKMGSLASKLADKVFITSDNPRHEDPEMIINDILKGIPNKEETFVESDRSVAIKLAISLSTSDDLVLIAGKGHEDYQIIGADKIFFDDYLEARDNLLKIVENT